MQGGEPAQLLLPLGYRIADQYEINDVLGVGGFGITYSCFDSALQRKVAVKEYLPTDLASRDSNSTVVAHTEARADFDWGLRAES